MHSIGTGCVSIYVIRLASPAVSFKKKDNFAGERVTAPPQHYLDNAGESQFLLGKMYSLSALNRIMALDRKTPIVLLQGFMRAKVAEG